MDELDELPVIRIIARQDVAGLDPVFLVQLQGSSKRVRRTRQHLEQEVPQLLKDFLRQHDVVDSPSTSGQDAEKSVVDETDASDASSSEQDLDETSDFDIAREQSPPKPLRKQKQLGPTRTSARTKGRSATSASSSISVSAQDSDFGSEDEFSHASSRLARQTNRHTRARQGRRNYHESSGTTASDDDEHDEDELAIGSTVEQRPSTKNTPKPLTTDSDSDDQVEANIEHAAGEPMPIENQHRDLCEKCGELPVPRALHNRAVLKRQRKGRKRKGDEFDLNSDDEEDELRRRGAWVECSVCLVSCHFACLAAPIAKQLVNKLKADWQADERLSRTPESSTDGDVEMQPVARSSKGPRPKQDFDINATFTIPKCGFCRRAGGRRCFECGVSGRKSIIDEPAKSEDQMDTDGPTASQRSKIPPLMFRCTMCKRACHYTCLGVEEGKEDAPRDSLHESYYKDGSCHQCYSWRGNTPEFILAWKPDEDLEQEKRTLNDVEEDDVRPEFEKVVKKDETSGKVYEIPSADDPTAAALYLVKWSGLSYRWLEWVPHSFLAARYHQKLANFLHKGSLVEFAAPAEDEREVDADDERFKQVESAPLPDPQAQERLPAAWSLVDRVLDVWFVNKHAQERRYDEYYKRLDPDPEVSIKLVYKAYIKWTELSYEASTIESPPQPGEPGYDRFVAAYKKFIESRKPSMLVPNLKVAQMDELDKPMSLSKFQHVKEQPDFIKNGNLMDFQLAGVSFLYRKWWSREGAVLADEMGLGKTVQVITFLSLLYNKQGARPFLVVVPNSTLGNWAREFERWAPDMRVVAYGGGKESRSIIEQYELFDPKGNLKSHVVLATYEGVEKNTAVFRRVARWDTLIVDEGQRLKGGTRGLLYKALQSLRIGSRVLLTGTPLNNSTGEVFNLLRFIDPNSRAHLTELEGRTTDLTTSAIDEIRSTLQKYMLRRTKELVLNLPPLNEIIVPLTMTGLQRKLYTSILERNVDFIASMAQGKKTTTKPRKKALNNVLMELRKLLGHPYLVDQDLERVGPTEEQTFQNFIHASTKLELLAKLLPKLKSQGHKVLIFSQFKLNLNILADFLEGIGLKYLRLDGNTDQLDRQRYINAFQAPDSSYDCFILSTRAGGVGITLTAADTVIMYDADFNPHQDVQAISRAHRIGQTKPVRVLKLVVKGSCEEKIMAAGRDKMRLDYLIIQRVEEKSGDEDLESILQFGAKALFDDKDFEAKAINYTDELIDDLLKKADNPPQTDKKADEGAAVFAQFQVYEAGEVVEGDKLGETNEENLHDFWSDILKKNEEEREVQLLQEAELGGRGRRRKAAQQVDYRVDVRPQASKQAAKRGKSSDSGVSPDSGEEWNGKRSAASSDDDEDYTLPYHMMSDVIIEDSRPAAVSGLAAQGSENRKEKRKDKGTNQDTAQPDRKRRKAHEVADAKARMYAQADRIAAEERNRQHALDRLGKSGQHRRQRIDRLKKLAHTVEDPYLISCLSEASKSTGDVQVMILQQVEESFRKQYGDLIDGLKRDYQAWAAGDPHVDSHVLMQKPSVANGASELGRPRSRGPFGSPRSINRVVAKAADSSEPSSRDTSRPSSSSGLPDRTQASTSASASASASAPASASTSTSTLAAAAPEQKAPEKPAKGGGGLLRWFSKMTSS